MDFRELTKYMDTFHKRYNIPGCDCCIYYNHVNVFRYRPYFTDENGKRKASPRDLYFIHSAAKIINCVSIMQLVESYRLELSDKVSKYIPSFDKDCTVKDMLKIYSQTYHYEMEIFNHKNMSRIIEAASSMRLNDYVMKNIFAPLKMKNSSFEINAKNRQHIVKQYKFDRKTKNPVERQTDIDTIFSKNDGCLITTVDDYALFAEAMCNMGMSKTGKRILTEKSVDVLINELVYKETEKDGVFVCIGFNGSMVLIDTNKKITIVYAQNIKTQSLERAEIYPGIKELAYKCLGADTWSGGHNIFP